LLSKNHPFLYTFMITTPGGDVVEAMKIGVMFRKYLIYVRGPTGVPQIGFMNLFSRTRIQVASA
jgi:hypothetical protein